MYDVACTVAGGRGWSGRGATEALLRQVRRFHLVHRSDGPPPAEDESGSEDDEEDPELRAYEAERVYVERGFVVLEGRGERVPLKDFRCAETNARITEAIDFVLGPDGRPRTKRAFLAAFGRGLEAATLQRLRKGDT